MHRPDRATRRDTPSNTLPRDASPRRNPAGVRHGSDMHFHQRKCLSSNHLQQKTPRSAHVGPPSCSDTLNFLFPNGLSPIPIARDTHVRQGRRAPPVLTLIEGMGRSLTFAALTEGITAEGGCATTGRMPVPPARHTGRMGWWGGQPLTMAGGRTARRAESSWSCLKLKGESESFWGTARALASRTASAN